MAPRLQPPLADLLEYAQGLGFGELHLEAQGQSASNPEPPRRRPAAQEIRRATPEPRRPAPVPPPTRRPKPAPEPPSAASPGPAAPQAPSAPMGPLPHDLEAVAAIAQSCRQCQLCEGRRSVVFGSGPPQADLMFVGEGPGAQEDLQGLPFVGPAGGLLTRIIGAIEMSRDEVYICNVVKCRPPRNRDPLPAEVAACRPYLERQIQAVAPKAIVALGRVAAQCLLNTSESLGRLRGRWHEVEGVPTRVTYHPAALLRSAQWKRPTWEDMKVVRDFLRQSGPGGTP